MGRGEGERREEAGGWREKDKEGGPGENRAKKEAEAGRKERGVWTKEKGKSWRGGGGSKMIYKREDHAGKVR
jgi:hypothetical protein